MWSLCILSPGAYSHVVVFRYGSACEIGASRTRQTTDTEILIHVDLLHYLLASCLQRFNASLRYTSYMLWPQHGYQRQTYSTHACASELSIHSGGEFSIFSPSRNRQPDQMRPQLYAGHPCAHLVQEADQHCHGW